MVATLRCALLLTVGFWCMPPRGEAQPHADARFFAPPVGEVASRAYFLTQDGKRGFTGEWTAQFRWRYFSLGPTVGLGSVSGRRTNVAGSLDGGPVIEHGQWRVNLQGRIGVARHSDVGAEKHELFEEYEPYPGVDATVSFAGGRVTLAGFALSIEGNDLWVGAVAGYDKDLEHVVVANPTEPYDPERPEFTEFGGSRTFLGVELILALAFLKPHSDASTQRPVPSVVH